MKLLYCDETNLQERNGDFLIYGGLVVEDEHALNLSHSVDALLRRFRVPDEYILKFNPGPPGMAHQDFIDLKEELINLTIANHAKIIVYAILHDIATTPDDARRNGINTICYHFQCILNRTSDPGLVLIDRFTDTGNAIEAHLREKFYVGVTGLPFTPVMRLSNIVGFHYSAVGQSHFPSIIDVALGSLRFALNAHTRDQQNYMGTASILLNLLSPLFWRDRPGAIPELGFQLSPQTIRREQYRQRYLNLKAFLENNNVPIAQTI